MNNKNRDHLAILPNLETYWSLSVPSDVVTCSVATKEMINICSHIFQSFDGFVQPFGISYKILLYPEGQKVPYENQTEFIETIERELHSDEVLDIDDFITSTQITTNEARWIPRVYFNHNRVKIQLKDGEKYIGRTESCVVYRHGDSLENDPTYDPLELEIWFAPNHEKSLDSDFVFYIKIKAHSDIWFEDSDIGKANRRNLSSFLARITSELPVGTIRRESNWYSESEMEDIY
jgi:hypothetical protein